MHYFKNFFKSHFLILILLLIFTANFNFFYNVYLLSKRSYDERLFRSYGWGCGGLSYGYVKKIYEKFLEPTNKKKLHILNFEVHPDTHSLFPQLKVDSKRINLVLLNFKSEDRNKINFNLDEEYTMVDKTENCYFFIKND